MAGNYFLHPLRVLVGKVESTPGTAETLTSADFDVRVRSPEVTTSVEIDESPVARGDLGEDDAVVGAQSGQISFSIRMTKHSTVTTQPAWWKFAQGCGCLPVLYAGKGYGLQPRDQYAEKTLTLWVFDIKRGATPTAVCYKFAGCMGNMVMTSAGVGKPWMANFTFTGKLQDIDMSVANASILSLVISDLTCAEKYINSQVYIGTTAEKCSSFSLDLGNEIQPVLDQSDATGYSYFAITSRKPRLSVNPLMTSTHDVWGQINYGETGCPVGLACMVGETGPGRYSLHIPKGQIISPAVANREGLVSWDLSIKCVANGYTGSVASGDLAPEVTLELLQGARS